MSAVGDPYAALPELYDLEHGDFADDVELYLRLAEVVGDPLLELGCGTGRLLAPLAAAGYQITGLDRSPAMLERARATIASKDLEGRVQLAEGEMTAADRAPGAPFGLVIIALNGLLHLASQREQRTVLKAAHRALDPRGMLVIDVLNPVPELLASFDGRVNHEGSWLLPAGRRVDRFASRTHSPMTQRISTELSYDIVESGSTLRRVHTSFPMRYVTPSELELLLELSGFVEWKLYGSYDLDPFDDTSERLIVTAEVTPS
jgi:SAM-dependent methyltransferase